MAAGAESREVPRRGEAEGCAIYFEHPTMPIFNRPIIQDGSSEIAVQRQPVARCPLAASRYALTPMLGLLGNSPDVSRSVRAVCGA